MLETLEDEIVFLKWQSLEKSKVCILKMPTIFFQEPVTKIIFNYIYFFVFHGCYNIKKICWYSINEQGV